MRDDNWFLNMKHLHYIKRADFDKDLNTRNISKKSIAFIDEGRLIWTHGKFYQCDSGGWEQLMSMLESLTFDKVNNVDGSTTYTLKGKDASGNDFSTDASFTLFENAFIEDAELIDEGKTLRIRMSSGQTIDVDLSKLFQIQDFVSTTSVEFILSPDPDAPVNTLIEAYARELQNAENDSVKVTANSDNVTITTGSSTIILGDNNLFVESQNVKVGDNLEIIVPQNIIIQGENGELSIDDDTNLTSSNNVNITSGDKVSVQGNSVDIISTNGDVVINSSEGNSVKITSPLYLSEDYPDVEQALEDLKNQITTGLSAGNGLIIEDSVVGIDETQYLETTQQYWDN